MRSIRKSVIESDDDATRSSSGGGSSAATAQRQIDLSLLRKPILTAVTGFMEAFRAYEAGTEEIRKLLANECDILYECRVCRNIFRSLTNFISHKRVYCRKLFNVAQHFHFQNDGFLDQDIATILQAEQDSQSQAKKANADVLNKDLSSIIERLRRKQHKLSTELSVTDYYDKINHKLTQSDLGQQQHLLQLDLVPNTEAAVFQTVRLGVADSMRMQVEELTNLNNNNSVLGPDGKVIQTQSRPQSALPIIRGPDEQYFRPLQLEAEEKPNEPSHTASFSCTECNLQFDTEKTLKVHTERKHTPSTYVYTCPSCQRTFMKPAAVIRHLCNDHKKSMRRIKVMRDSILKRRVRADEVVVKGPSRELSRLQQGASNATTNGTHSGDGTNTDHDEAAATRAWMENMEHFGQGPMCSYCGKTFERKAVLTTHMQTCVHKLRQTENGSAPLASSTSSTNNRRSKGKEEPSLPAVMKIKQEPVDPVISDDSNSYDVPLSTIQTRTSEKMNNPLVMKPEELTKQEDRETVNRRKRKKPTIMLRNATDDISWESGETLHQSTPVKVEEIIVNEVQIKQEVVEKSDQEILQIKKATRNRKRRSVEKDEAIEKEMIEKLELGEEIVCRCLKRFTDPVQYKTHMKAFHYRQKRFWCAVCEFKGYRKVDTINHITQEHSYQGDAKDISSLIHVQMAEKRKKSTPESTTNIADPISAIIEAVNQSCDTSHSDISFLDTGAGNSPPSVPDASMVSTASATLNESATAVPNFERPIKRKRPARLSRKSSICVIPPEIPKMSKSLPDVNVCLASKRPVRNRVKHVEKDFVYDLTHLLHKDEDLDDFPLPELVCDNPSSPTKAKPEPTRPASQNSTSPNKRESLRSHAPKPIAAHLVKGAAFQMARQQVEIGRAALHRPPDIPHERTFVPAQVTPPRRITTIHDWPVIKKDRKIGSIIKQQTEIQLKRVYARRASTLTSSVLPELIRDKRKSFPRRHSVVPTRLKPSASIEILNKLNASRTAAGLAVVEMTDVPVMVKCPTEVEFRQIIETKLKDHQAVMMLANPNGTTVEDVFASAAETPRKRITLMQRLQENRSKRMQQEQKERSSTMEKVSPSQTTAPAETMAPEQPPLCSTSKSVPNVAEMLHAKLKRFSSF